MSFPGTPRWQGSKCCKLLLHFYVSLRYRAFQLQVRKRKCPTKAEGVLCHGWVSCEVSSVKWCTSWGHHSWNEHHFSTAPLPCATHRLCTCNVADPPHPSPQVMDSFFCLWNFWNNQLSWARWDCWVLISLPNFHPIIARTISYWMPTTYYTRPSGIYRWWNKQVCGAEFLVPSI